MQQLIEQLNRQIEEGGTSYNSDGYAGFIGGIMAAITEVEFLLEEEKEQLIQAVYRGDEGESFYGSLGDLEGFINARQNAEEWFERTYESNA